MNKKKELTMVLYGALLLMSGCVKTTTQQEVSDYKVKGDTVRILNAEWAKNIKVAQAASIPYVKEVVTSGIVKPIPTLYANVASPFAGRVVSSFVGVGQRVEQGAPLFEIICADFTTAQKEYFQACAAKDFALKDLKRKEDMVQNGVCSQKELEEAQNALLVAEKDFENSRTALEIYQVGNLDQMKLGEPLVVRAPISGEVLENNIVNGQYLKDDADAAVVVADLSKVWVSAQVKEKDIRFVNEDSSLDMAISAFPGCVMTGRVFHIDEAVDEDTRSICVLSECENKDEMLKLGMYTTVRFMSEPLEMVEVPETALLQGERDNYVFVQIAPDTFVRRDVKVEITKNHKAVISEGLKQGEKIIGAGGYYLKL